MNPPIVNPPKQNSQSDSPHTNLARAQRDVDKADGRGTSPTSDKVSSNGFEKTELPGPSRLANGPQPEVIDNDIASAAVDLAKAAAVVISTQASEIASNVADEASAAIGTQKTRGAETMRGFAKAIHTAANELTQQSPSIARQFHSAAEKVEDLSGRLTNKSVGDLMHETTALARQQPGVFFAGAVVAGFALARFLKSGAAGPGDRGDASMRTSSPDRAME